tara:strand:- start:1980 stop:2891 length:912 start_codon:yes stop_codon:yes gene_type:complete
MANDKLHGYNPDPSKEIEENRLDSFNPSEFRKGMDYELTTVGCSRLAESTPDERNVATEKVLKNLKEHGGYYSGLIQFEGGMNHGSKITEKSFKKWLESFMPGDPGTGMVEVDKEIKTDKMTELKEAIKAEVKSILAESKGKEAEKINKADAQKEKDDDKASTTTAKGKTKKLASLEKEIAKLEIEKTKLKDSQKAPLQKYKDGKMSSSEYSTATKDSVKRIKDIIARLGEIENEKDEITLAEKMGRREVAKTMMEKDTHMEILNIIKEAGVNLREGADGIKMYYEIAKTAYQEGFMAGVNKN